MKSDEGQTRRGSKPEDALDFEELYKEFASRIRGLATRRLSDPHLAEDVVQETLIKAYKYQSARDKERQVWPWLWKIASNACSDLLSGSRTPEYLTPEVEEASRLDTAKTAPGPEELYFKGERLKVTIAALATLPPRYRRILLLKHAEGWSYGDIAGMEQTSIDSVDAVLKRARHQFRESYAKLAQEKGLPKSPFAKRKDGSTIGGLLVPGFFREAYVRLRLKIREAAGRTSQWLSDGGASMNLGPAAIANTLVAAGLVIGLGLGSVTSEASAPQDAATAGAAAQDARAFGRSANWDLSVPQIAPGPAGGSSSASASRNVNVLANSQHAANHLIGEFNPNSEETPESTQFYSIAASPNYENDRTILASGACSSYYNCYAIFQSQDGGASWTRLPARNFVGGPGRLLLSPNFSQDRRVFWYDFKVVQESKNGGEDWQPRVLLPLRIDRAVLSPFFAAGDRRLIFSVSSELAAVGVMDYWPDTGQLKPSGYGELLPAGYRLLGASPDYRADPALYLGDGYRLYRCRGSCTLMSMAQELGYVNQVMPSPRFNDDGVMLLEVLSDGQRVAISSDWAHSFQETGQGNTGQVLPFYGPSGELLIVIAAGGFEYTLIRSSDGGASWSSSNIPLYGFGGRLQTLAATPTGRVFAAAGMHYGIACSVDSGLTWARRCFPER